MGSEHTSMKSIESLSTDVFEPRTATGRLMFQVFINELLPSKIIKTAFSLALKT